MISKASQLLAASTVTSKTEMFTRRALRVEAGIQDAQLDLLPDPGTDPLPADPLPAPLPDKRICSTNIEIFPDPTSSAERTFTRPTSPAEIGWFDSETYHSQSWSQKLNDLWQQCLADTNGPEPASYALDEIFRENNLLTFQSTSDEMPQGVGYGPCRKKLVHSQGVVGLVVWESLGIHPYTGLFKGSNALTKSKLQGLIRLSEANFLVPEASGLTPTFAMKFPRNKIPSANILANTSFEPSNSYNFFENDFKCRVNLCLNPLNQQTIQRKFLEETETFQSFGLSDFSRFNVDGSPVTNFVFPFELTFAPTPEVKSMFPAVDTGIPWYDQLQTIPEGTILFQAWARNQPNDPLKFKSRLQHIANIVLITKLTTCSFGDKRLFFKHEYMDPDFAAQPSWKDYVPRLNSADAWGTTPILDFPTKPVEQKAWLRGQLNDYGCPFAWLLNEPVNPIY